MVASLRTLGRRRVKLYATSHVLSCCSVKSVNISLLVVTLKLDYTTNWRRGFFCKSDKMSVHVPAPAMFLPCPGEPSIPFETWLRMFRNYMLVINATRNAWPTTRKRAILLHCLGAEGQRIFYALPDSGTSLEQAVAALQKHFIPKVNVVVERHTF